MHQPFYYQKLEDYDCDCSSYILLKENGQNWQKVFKLTERSYERSPLYLYWENLPIEKVKFLARATQRDFVFIFNGTGTDSTSWYRNDKLIEQPLAWNTQYNFTSNNDITEPYFRIDYGATSNYGNWMETKIVNGTYEIYYNSNGKYNSITELVISVLFK
ncbi:uncharacterized protein LOC106874575 [Octopus bimaculoides]|uniref:uncharacterized protein LOC106874575 n=1 Tax=Octopus bimaculoides TaxID=37653 RepID=UPI0022E79DF1|nr:uncharacterized protein LOC106874575 [Octopus bimaculoides]